MPLPVPVERIDEEQDRVGRPFPAGLRARLLGSDGGDLFIGDERWTHFPAWDPGSRRSAGRSAGHIARETAAFYVGLAGVLAPGLVAIGENDSGDYLVLDPSSCPLAWRHETNALEAVDVEWDRDGPRARQRSQRAEAVERVMTGLTALRDGPTASLVIEAPRTGIHLQLARVPDGLVGESVGERNLSKLHAQHMAATMRATLRGLGWAEPSDQSIDSGNWTRTWSAGDWDTKAVARLVVRTFSEVYGLEPWALSVRFGVT